MGPLQNKSAGALFLLLLYLLYSITCLQPFLLHLQLGQLVKLRSQIRQLFVGHFINTRKTTFLEDLSAAL